MTFVQAHHRYNARAVAMRDIDARFSSVVLVANHDLGSLADLKGKRFAFGAYLSTSGHWMPRHFFEQEQQIVPETYFSDVAYSGKHDRTAYWVRDGAVDAGVANAAVIRSMQSAWTAKTKRRAHYLGDPSLPRLRLGRPRKPA